MQAPLLLIHSMSLATKAMVLDLMAAKGVNLIVPEVAVLDLSNRARS